MVFRCVSASRNRSTYKETRHYPIINSRCYRDCVCTMIRFVDGSPDGLPFAVICLLVRVVEALGASALITSSFAIIANTFPDSVTAMFVRSDSVLVNVFLLDPAIGDGFWTWLKKLKIHCKSIMNQKHNLQILLQFWYFEWSTC